MEQAGVQLIAQGANVYIGDLKSATNATTTFVDATDKGSGRVSKAGEIMTGALRHVGTLAVEAFAQAAKATAAFIGDSISLAGDFEAGMLNFQAVAGRDVDTQGLEQFRDLFIDIGKRLPVSTADVQKAAIELVKGGIDPATVAAGGLEASIKFAAAAMDGDLVGAAEISAKIVGGWAEVTDTAAERSELLAHAQDTLTRAANASTVGVQDLSLGLFNVQGNAKLAGIGLDETVQALSLIAPNFSSAATAGTALNAMIARLQPTTDPARDAMQGLGLYTEAAGSAFYDAQGAFIGWSAASQLLQDATNGLTDAQKQSVFQTIFGMDAMGAAAELTRQGAAGWDQMSESLAKANGVQENAALKQQGFNTALDNMKGSVEALQITIGSALLPVLADLLNNYISPAINTLTDLADALGGDEEAFKKLSPVVQDIIKWFDTVDSVSVDLGSAVDDLSGVWEKAVTVVEAVADAYLNIAEAVLPIVQGFVAEHGEEIEAFFKATWDSIIEIVNLALDIYNSIVPPVLNAIAGFIEDHGSEIQKVFGGVWEMVTSLITGALETIKGVLSLALHVIQGDWEAAWEDVKAIGKAQWDAITGFVTGFLDAIAGIFDTTLADILQTWENNWNMAVDIVTSVDWLQVGADVVSGIISGIEGAASSLFSTLRNLASDALDAAKDALGISSPSREFATVGQFAVQGMMQGITDTWPQLIDLVGSISNDLIDEMSDIGAQMRDAIADSFGSTATIDRQMAKNLDAIGDIQDEFTRKVVAQDLDALKKKAESLFTDPKDVADYYKMVSGHEFETLKLREQIANATSQEEKDRLNQQLILISRAQDAELDQFYTRNQGQQTVGAQIADSINAVMLALSEVDLTDDQIKIVDMLAGVREALTRPPQTTYTPGYTGQTTNNSQTVNMPIYTNNSPAALQQSWAILQASMP